MVNWHFSYPCISGMLPLVCAWCRLFTAAQPERSRFEQHCSSSDEPELGKEVKVSSSKSEVPSSKVGALSPKVGVSSSESKASGSKSKVSSSESKASGLEGEVWSLEGKALGLEGDRSCHNTISPAFNHKPP
jgi:hypothetical protein